jgi:8-oxo-dGTP pyrophosphatase MutT (NUDIX family)
MLDVTHGRLLDRHRDSSVTWIMCGTSRRMERRWTARILLLDPDGRVLLFEDSDPGLPGPPTFWITPGGALDPGETVEQAAIRELAEETGLVLDPARLRGPVAHRTVLHGYSDKIVEQDETYFAAAVPSFVVDITGHTVEEQTTFLGHRWWNPAELLTTSERVWPTSLTDLLEAVDHPDSWPIPIDDAEESTVPVRAGCPSSPG